MKVMYLKIAALVQARTGSTRLPSKVLLDIGGKTMLERVVERVQRAKLLNDTIIATSTNKGDDAIMELCLRRGWPCFRGSEEDVLHRFAQAATNYQIDVVVRITCDCPLIDPELIDDVVARIRDNYPNLDYVSNSLIRSFPRGTDVEAILSESLFRELLICTEHRDCVTQGFRKNYDSNYRISTLVSKQDFSAMRWCVDTAEDMEFVRKVFHHFKESIFSWRDVLTLLLVHPDWIIKDTQKEPV